MFVSEFDLMFEWVLIVVLMLEYSKVLVSEFVFVCL